MADIQKRINAARAAHDVYQAGHASAEPLNATLRAIVDALAGLGAADTLELVTVERTVNGGDLTGPSTLLSLATTPAGAILYIGEFQKIVEFDNGAPVDALFSVLDPNDDNVSFEQSSLTAPTGKAIFLPPGMKGLVAYPLATAFRVLVNIGAAPLPVTGQAIVRFRYFVQG